MKQSAKCKILFIYWNTRNRYLVWFYFMER